MPRGKPSFWEVDDGTVVGRVSRVKVECQVCYKQDVAGIEVENILLPESIKPSSHLLFFSQVVTEMPGTKDVHVLVDYASPIGISCGCYARAHRQLAHITTRQKSNGKS